MAPARSADKPAPVAQKTVSAPSAPAAPQSTDEETEKKKAREELARLLHKRELGLDPAIGGRFRPAEAEVAALLEQVLGRRLRRALKDEVGDWVDEAGRTYDAVGPVPPEHFNAQSFSDSVKAHLKKQGLDQVVVVVRELPPESRAAVDAMIMSLPPEERTKLLVLR
jgi:hypothetical protein